MHGAVKFIGALIVITHVNISWALKEKLQACYTLEHILKISPTWPPDNWYSRGVPGGGGGENRFIAEYLAD